MYIAFHYVPDADPKLPHLQILAAGESVVTAELLASGAMNKYLDWPCKPFDSTWEPGTIYTIRASEELYDMVVSAQLYDMAMTDGSRTTLAKIEFVIVSVGHVVECEERERWAEVKKNQGGLPKKPNLFQDKEFTTHAGLPAYFKIECDALTQDDLNTLALIVSKNFDFKQVIGIPTGGTAFANALQKYTNPEATAVLIVDDVLTTGMSMENAFDRVIADDPEADIIGVVIFARDRFPYWITPVFQMMMK